VNKWVYLCVDISKRFLKVNTGVYLLIVDCL